MKVLIWCGCFFVLVLVQVAFEYSGFILGLIPSVIMFGGTWWIAHTLCKKFDEYDKRRSREVKTTDEVQGPYKSRFTECPKCGYIAVFEKECPKCGFIIPTEIQDDGAAESLQILYCRKCGSKLLEGACFCKECGTEIIMKGEGSK